MNKITALAFAALLAAGSAIAADSASKTVEAVNKEKTALAGKEVVVKGKVAKVNNNIMGRNFVHVQDGTGDANTNNLIFTSKQTANVGQEVVAKGKVTLNRDFGMGYMYPLLVEDSTIDVVK